MILERSRFCSSAYSSSSSLCKYRVKTVMWQAPVLSLSTRNTMVSYNTVLSLGPVRSVNDPDCLSTLRGSTGPCLVANNVAISIGPGQV